MNDSLDIKAVWQMAQFKVPNQEEISINAQQFKRKEMKKLIITNTLLALTVTGIIALIAFSGAQFITSIVGVSLIVIGIVYFLAFYHTYLPQLIRSKYTTSNLDFLNELIELKTKQKRLHGKALNVFFALLSFGVFLAIYEFAAMLPTTAAVLAYSGTLVWLGVNWFYFRRLAQSKEKEKLNKIIKHYQYLSNQFNLEQSS